MDTPFLRTVLGDVSTKNLGLILPHEHLFTDLRGPNTENYAQDDPDLVVKVLSPFLHDAQMAGVSALIECSTIGVGRNIEILRHIAKHTQIHIIAPTGLYKEGFIPDHFLVYNIASLSDLWIQEITHGIEESTSKAGFIKIAVSDEGPTKLEVRNIRAAAQASKATGAAIASHTIGGRAALEQLAILRDEGLNLDRFIWVHADSEPDLSYHAEVAAEGAYVEFDFIGQPNTDPHRTVDRILHLVEANLTERILLSHDAGWFQPGNVNGQPEGGVRGYSYISEDFIPLLAQRSVDEKTVQHLTEDNPKKAFALMK
jgi:phosphotriesterase-related protein